MTDILIGTSGYDYPEWKGVFYPENLARKDFLAYYATKFNAVELNNTFYTMPTADRMKSFYERSGGKLFFSVKANRLLTHEISRDWKNAAADFKTAVTPLLEKNALSAVLFQLPQSFHYVPENRIYLANLLSEFKDFPAVVEFRHKEWIRDSVFEGMDKRGVGIVFCDMPKLQNLPAAFPQNAPQARTPFTGKTAYIRAHGRNANAWYSQSARADTLNQIPIGTRHEVAHAKDDSPNGCARYDYEYSSEELREFVPVIRAAVAEGKTMQVYFNNHPKGSGARNALEVMEMIVR